MDTLKFCRCVLCIYVLLIIFIQFGFFDNFEYKLDLASKRIINKYNYQDSVSSTIIKDSLCKDMHYYIYNDTAMTMNNWPGNCKGKLLADKLMLENMKNSHCRTLNISKARYYVIPTLFILSQKCDENGYEARANTALTALVNNPYFNGGQNHILMAHSFHFTRNWPGNPIPDNWWKSLENVTLTRFEYYGNNYAECQTYTHFDKTCQKTKYSITVPYGTFLNITEPSFSQWKQRKNLIFHHTTTNRMATVQATILRQLPVYINLTGSIGHHISREEWETGWSDSKFCIVVRGDSPSSHAFSNAISGACIPVIISDAFSVAVPFDIDFKLFSIVIKEKQFLKSPMIDLMLADLPEDLIKSKLDALKKVQPKLLYHHPRTQVAEEFFIKLNKLQKTLLKEG